MTFFISMNHRKLQYNISRPNFHVFVLLFSRLSIKYDETIHWTPPLSYKSARSASVARLILTRNQYKNRSAHKWKYKLPLVHSLSRVHLIKPCTQILSIQFLQSDKPAFASVKIEWKKNVKNVGRGKNSIQYCF
jgi:hypothetical protein